MNSVIKWFYGRSFILFIISFHLAGVLLYVVPPARPILELLIPSILMICLTLILISHPEWSWQSLVTFLMIYILAILLEMKGVTDDRLFGAYQYHDSLGIKVRGVPLLIGVNWLMLTYCSHSISRKLSSNMLLRLVSAAGIMVLYDLLLEIVAPHLNMWSFDRPFPPLQNFLAWFIAAIVFLSLLEIFKVNTGSKPARILMLAQLSFFLILAVYSLLSG